MKPGISLFALLLFAIGISHAQGDSPDAVLDGLHEAGTAADPSGFFAQMTTDAVILGVDASGALEGPALRRHFDERFATGDAWGYRSVERDIRYSPDGNMAWFTESLEDSEGGHRWGSGVLIRTGSGWKITQYATTALTGSGSGSGTVTAPVPAVVQQGDDEQVDPAQSATPVSAGTATVPAEPKAKKHCKKIRHKTNKVSRC